MDEQPQSIDPTQSLTGSRPWHRSRGVVGSGSGAALSATALAAELHSCLISGGLAAPWSAQAKVVLAILACLTTAYGCYGRIVATERIG